MKEGGQIVVLSAPSGGGKTTICKEILNKHPYCRLSVSATTRAPRPGEKEGEAYYFLSRSEFEHKIKSGEFLEYENVHGNWYGTLKSEVSRLQRQNYIVLFDVDVKGALNIKKVFPSAKLIFIKPPNYEVLMNRLKNRQTESDEAVKKRLDRLPLEFAEGEKFDYVVVNDDLEEAIKEVEKIIGLDR